MPAATIIGLQWGDEGKGKVLDALAAKADVVARWQGGGNAGHTVIVGGQKHVFHHVPTGALHRGVTCVIGTGTVLDLVALQSELTELREGGVNLDGLRISDRAHVVFPYHKALDEAREGARGEGTKIGTTKRGIGPCYADKASRTGIRVADLYDGPRFAERLRRSLDEKNAILCHLFRRAPLSFEPIHQETLAAAEAIRPYVTETASLLQQSLTAGKRVLFEGAQGVMLDIDHGTYPWVTSSSASAAGAAAGLGVPPGALGRVLGVAKAYTTRVGAGPFPSELPEAEGARLRELGHEYGATTGRPRRCGWLDLVQLRWAIALSGTTGVVLTKLDTLAGFGPLQVCTGYRLNGRECLTPPADEAGWTALQPVYRTLEGFPAGSVAGARSWNELPLEARAYVEAVEQALGVPVVVISTGAERSEMIRRGTVEGW